MQNTDIEFTIGLNTSPAEQKLNNLFNDAGTARKRLQKVLNSGTSSQVYESKLNKLDKLIGRAGSNPSNMSKADYNRFINLRNDIARYERITGKFSSSASKVLNQVNKYSENKNGVDPFLKNIAQTDRLSKYYGGGHDLLTKYNKAYTQGVFEKWKALTTPSNVLALPAPLSQEEKKLDSKHSITSKMNEDLKKIRKEKKETVQEEKALNREHDAGIIKLFKITSILYGIKKLIQGIGKLWRFEVNTNLATTARDVQEKGFFSTDARNALRSNTNKERASIARGLQYMGQAAPFQMGDLDSAVKALQDLRLKAMSGQGIKDDQRVISLDRLTRRLGLNWNVGQMLSNPNLDLTGMLVDLSDAIERYLPKLDKLKDIDKNLTINDMLTVLGDKLMDAVVYHANYNARTGGAQTMMEETKKTGSTVNLPIDYTKAGKDFADAFAKSVASSDLLKTAFSAWIKKPALGILGFVKEKKDRATQWFNLQNLVNNGFTGPGTVLVASDYHYLKRDKNEEKLNKKWALAHKNEINTSIENFLQHPESATDEDVLRFLNFGDPSLESGVFGHGVESLGLLGLASKYSATNAPSFDAMINNPKRFGLSDKDVSIIKKVKQQYPTLNKLGGLDDWQDALGKMQNDIWGEGAIGDYSPEKGQKITDYLRALWGDNYYYGFLRNLYTGSNSILKAGGIYTGSNEMNVDGKIVIELKRSDLTGSVEVHSLPATITVNGTKQAIEMAVTD